MTCNLVWLIISGCDLATLNLAADWGRDGGGSSSFAVFVLSSYELHIFTYPPSMWWVIRYISRFCRSRKCFYTPDTSVLTDARRLQNMWDVFFIDSMFDLHVHVQTSELSLQHQLIDSCWCCSQVTMLVFVTVCDLELKEGWDVFHFSL